MTFSYDPTTDRGKVRMLLQDRTDGTLGTNYFFSDADIDAALEMNGDGVWYACADLCRAQAARLVGSSFYLELAGAITLDRKRTSNYWLELAKEFEGRANSSSDNLVEFVDSFDYSISQFGSDDSEYVGD